MKRALVILPLLALLLLCACGRAPAAESPSPAPAEPPEPTPAAAQTPAPTPVPLVLPELSLEESCRMANTMNANRALLADSVLYCYEFDPEYRPVLARYTLHGSELRDFRILARDCVPSCLHALEGRLFYINLWKDGSVESIPLGGGEAITLVEGPCSSLSVREDGLTYCREDRRIYRSKLDGSEERPVTEELCWYPYPLGELLLYQSGSRGERLMLLCPEDGRSIPLSIGAGYAPLLYGDRLWYSGAEGLVSAELDGRGEREEAAPAFEGAAELLPTREGLLLRGLRETGSGLLQWSLSPGGSVQSREQIYRLCDYIGTDHRVDTVYMPDGRIRCFALVLPDGSELLFMAGKPYEGTVEQGDFYG